MHFLCRQFCAFLLTAWFVGAWSSTRAHAAELDADCCIDLDQRIAEFEAAAVRRGGRKVSLTVTGQVSRALLSWDDGRQRNTYSVGNKNDQTNFIVLGGAEISPEITAGYELVIRVSDALSDSTHQLSSGVSDGLEVWKSNWWVETGSLGKVTLGRASRVSDTAPETDLSNTAVAGYAGVQDVNGAFHLRRMDGRLADLTWGDIASHLNGDTANVVRYDSPEFGGFTVSASWGEDDIWDAGLRYTFEGNGIMFDAVLAYTQVTDDADLTQPVDEDTVVGSASILHQASGLNFTVAAGQRRNNAAVTGLDSAVRGSGDAKFLYLKAGWLTNLNSLGQTAFYGEAGRFEDFVAAETDAGQLATLASGGVGCATAQAACRITGSTANVWGFGVVQPIEAAGMQMYLGYRNYSAGLDLEDGLGGAASDAALEDFQTIISGAKISF